MNKLQKKKLERRERDGLTIFQHNMKMSKSFKAKKLAKRKENKR